MSGPYYASALATAIKSFQSASTTTQDGTNNCGTSKSYPTTNFPGDGYIYGSATRTSAIAVDFTDWSSQSTSSPGTSYDCGSTCLTIYAGTRAQTNAGSTSSLLVSPNNIAVGSLSFFYLQCSAVCGTSAFALPFFKGMTNYCPDNCWGAYYGKGTAYRYNWPEVSVSGNMDNYGAGCLTSGMFMGMGPGNIESILPFYRFSINVRAWCGRPGERMRGAARTFGPGGCVRIARVADRRGDMSALWAAATEPRCERRGYLPHGAHPANYKLQRWCYWVSSRSVHRDLQRRFVLMVSHPLASPQITSGH